MATRKPPVTSIRRWHETRVRRRRAQVLFDSHWYSRRYGDLRSGANLFAHYLDEGWRAGNDPHPLFDTAWYVSAHPELLEGASPLEDFVARPTSRRPNRYFDPNLWARHMAEAGEEVVEYLAGLSLASDDPRTHADDRSCIRNIDAGRGRLEDDGRVCVYAHFDPHGVVDPYVLSALDGLADAGWQTVFCSSCDRLRASDVEAVRKRAAFVLTAPNTGFDWGLYHAALGFVLERTAPASVALLNDSVYVDRRRLPQFLDRVITAAADAVGATDSLELERHLQSYFIHLGRAVMAGEPVRELLGHYVPIAEKRYVVNAYEIGFSRRITENGLTLGAIYPIAALTASSFGSGGAGSSAYRSLEKLNPSRHLWDVLLAEGSPFMKVQLLTRDPEDVPDVGLLDRRLPTDLAATIRAHARRVGKRVARW
jgi:hypothetical protein